VQGYEGYLYSILHNTAICIALSNPKHLATFLLSTIYGLRVSSKSNAIIKDLQDIAATALEVLK
jgi:hypothetical protein